MKKLIVLFALVFTLKSHAVEACISNVLFTPNIVAASNECNVDIIELKTGLGINMITVSNSYRINVYGSCYEPSVCTNYMVATGFFRAYFTVDCWLPNCCAGEKLAGVVSWDGPGGHHSFNVYIPPNICHGMIIFHCPSCAPTCEDWSPATCVQSFDTCDVQGPGGGDTD